MSANIIENNLGRYLKDIVTAQDITTVLRKGKQGSNWFLNEIIDGPYDVDKLDYMNRDSYHCGTKVYDRLHKEV